MIDFLYNSENSTLEYDDSNFTDKEILHDIDNFNFSYGKTDGTDWTSGEPVDEIKRVYVNFDLTMQDESKTYDFTFFVRN